MGFVVGSGFEEDGGGFEEGGGRGGAVRLEGAVLAGFENFSLANDAIGLFTAATTGWKLVGCLAGCEGGSDEGLWRLPTGESEPEGNAVSLTL